METNEFLTLTELYEKISDITQDPNPNLVLEFLLTEDLFDDEDFKYIKVKGYNSELNFKTLLNLIESQPNNIIFGPEFVHIICGDEEGSSTGIRKMDQSQKMRHSNTKQTTHTIGRN